MASNADAAFHASHEAQLCLYEEYRRAQGVSDERLREERARLQEELRLQNDLRMASEMEENSLVQPSTAPTLQTSMDNSLLQGSWEEMGSGIEPSQFEMVYSMPPWAATPWRTSRQRPFCERRTKEIRCVYGKVREKPSCWVGQSQDTVKSVVSNNSQQMRPSPSTAQAQSSSRGGTEQLYTQDAFYTPDAFGMSGGPFLPAMPGAYGQGIGSTTSRADSPDEAPSRTPLQAVASMSAASRFAGDLQKSTPRNRTISNDSSPMHSISSARNRPALDESCPQHGRQFKGGILKPRPCIDSMKPSFGRAQWSYEFDGAHE